MEIERKFLIKKLPNQLEEYKSRHLEQGYLCTKPVVRIRKQDDEYYLTYKGGGFMAREEVNLPLSEEGYLHLLQKIDGHLISKRRYLIPLEKGLTAELDIFNPPLAPLQLLEVEFPSIEEANSFQPPEWFGDEVTYDKRYHNSNMIYLTNFADTNENEPG